MNNEDDIMSILSWSVEWKDELEFIFATALTNNAEIEFASSLVVGSLRYLNIMFVTISGTWWITEMWIIWMILFCIGYLGCLIAICFDCQCIFRAIWISNMRLVESKFVCFNILILSLKCFGLSFWYGERKDAY